MTYTRRQFVRHTCQALTAAAFTNGFHRFGLMNAMAQGDSYKALVCIFLFGGNDSYNMVVDLDQYSIYQDRRGDVALSRTGPQALVPVSAQDGHPYGLHPNLTAVSNLYTQGKVALLCGVGSLVRPITRAEYMKFPALRPPQLFSHSDQQKQWQTASHDGSVTGFGGRILDRLIEVAGFWPSISVSGVTIFTVGTRIQPVSLQGGGAAVVDDERLYRRGPARSPSGLERNFEPGREATTSGSGGRGIHRRARPE